ncbi:MAG: hypothetical protein DMD91_28035 [Candidatus Rokuibacteriota bacterium]|nr:MAG: hypothetical protein DMD91_28035 [Candidatus Rokubacteria bacterium]
MKIAFISMSGVRVRTEELAQLGVTLPGFVDRGSVIASLPSLAGVTLAALTPADARFDYYDVADVTGAPVLDGYDLVAFSTFTAMAYECYALADRYRAAGVPTVIGGLHATLVPDEAKRHADAVCVGEGETLWPRIVEDARTGKLQPMYREENRGSYPLSRTPVPRFELLDIERYNRLTVQTSRGCPLDCEFCAASKIYGRYRIKPVAQVIAEIDAILKIWPSPFIEFADDNTFVDKSWAKAFVRELRTRRVRWFTETDVSLADDSELLELLAGSGCQQVLVRARKRAASRSRAHRPRELEDEATGHLRAVHRRGPGARHHRERLLHRRPRLRHTRRLHRDRRFRETDRLARVPDHRPHPVPRHPALREAQSGGATAARRVLGSLHFVRREFPAEGDERRPAGVRAPLVVLAALLLRGADAPTPALHGHPEAAHDGRHISVRDPCRVPRRLPRS